MGYSTTQIHKDEAKTLLIASKRNAEITEASKAYDLGKQLVDRLCCKLGQYLWDDIGSCDLGDNGSLYITF